MHCRAADETSLKTNMVKTTGWSPKGARLIDNAPFGHWKTQTFIAALRHDRLDAAWVINGAMNGELFDLCLETRLAPTLQTGEVFGPLTRTSGVRGLTPGQDVIPQKPDCSGGTEGCRRMVSIPSAP